MPREMTGAEILAFMMEAPRTGHLATVRADGRPHVTPLWFMVDGESVLFATAAASVKGQALSQTKFAALSVDDSSPPFSYVSLEGPVELVDDLRQVRNWAAKIAARYMGAEWADEYARSEGFPDDLLCRLTPSHKTGHANMAD